MIQKAPFGVHMFELQEGNRLVFMGASESANAILKIDCKQFIGKTIEEVFPALVNTPILDMFRKVAKNGEHFNTETVDYNEQGILGAFQITTSQIGDNQMAVFFTDITEKKKNEMTVKESHERAKAFAEATYEGIVILDHGVIVDANQQFVKMHRFNSVDEMVGLNVVDFSLPENRQMVEKQINTNDETLYETLSCRKDGTIFPSEIRGKAFLYGNKSLRVTTIRDLTERKRSERELENKNNELEQIVYVTSHDLRSPLVNVQGYSKEISFLIDDIKNLRKHCNDLPNEMNHRLSEILEKEIPEAFHYIDVSIAKMDSLLQGLLRLSRSGRVQLNVVKLNMNQLLNEVISGMEFLIKEHNVSVEYANLPPCFADIGMLNQVFSNLIDNAIKYRSSDRPCRIKISAEIKSENVVYCVEDNGIGIAKDHLEKVFEIFYRLHPKGVKGEGLGLAIVRKILNRMHGDINLQSTLGEGCKFFVSLPFYS